MSDLTKTNAQPTLEKIFRAIIDKNTNPAATPEDIEKSTFKMTKINKTKRD